MLSSKDLTWFRLVYVLLNKYLKEVRRFTVNWTSDDTLSVVVCTFHTPGVLFHCVSVECTNKNNSKDHPWAEQDTLSLDSAAGRADRPVVSWFTHTHTVYPHLTHLPGCVWTHTELLCCWEACRLLTVTFSGDRNQSPSDRKDVKLQNKISWVTFLSQHIWSLWSLWTIVASFSPLFWLWFTPTLLIAEGKTLGYLVEQGQLEKNNLCAVLSVGYLATTCWDVQQTSTANVRFCECSPNPAVPCRRQTWCILGKMHWRTETRQIKVNIVHWDS